MEEVYMKTFADIGQEQGIPAEVVEIGEAMLEAGRGMPVPEFGTKEELEAYGLGLLTASQVMSSVYQRKSKEGAKFDEIFTFALSLIAGGADAVLNLSDTPTPSVRPS